MTLGRRATGDAFADKVTDCFAVAIFVGDVEVEVRPAGHEDEARVAGGFGELHGRIKGANGIIGAMHDEEGAFEA